MILADVGGIDHALFAAAVTCKARSIYPVRRMAQRSLLTHGASKERRVA